MFQFFSQHRTQLRQSIWIKVEENWMYYEWPVFIIMNSTLQDFTCTFTVMLLKIRWCSGSIIVIIVDVVLENPLLLKWFFMLGIRVLYSHSLFKKKICNCKIFQSSFWLVFLSSTIQRQTGTFEVLLNVFKFELLIVTGCKLKNPNLVRLELLLLKIIVYPKMLIVLICLVSWHLFIFIIGSII